MMNLRNVKILILLMMRDVHLLCVFVFCYFYLLLYHYIIRVVYVVLAIATKDIYYIILQLMQKTYGEPKEGAPDRFLIDMTGMLQ